MFAIRTRAIATMGLEVDTCPATDWQQSPLGLAVQRRTIGAQAVNQLYIDAARLLIQVAPVVFESGLFALKGGTAINLFVRDMPRLSVDLDLVFTDHSLPRDRALKRIGEALQQSAERLKARGFETRVQP